MIKSSIGKLIKHPLNSLGYEVISKADKAKADNSAAPMYPERIALMKKNGFNPNVVFDCGAHKGIWSKTIHKLFPEARYFLFEPNPVLWERIEKNLSSVQMKYKLYKAAVGSKKGTAELNLWENIDPNGVGSSLCEHITGDPTKKVKTEVISLDDIADENNIVPDFVKLDLEGFEVEALKGSSRILQKTEVFMIEFGCLEAFIGRATVQEIINIMYSNDYALYDICNLSYRPYDNAMTGGDFIFAKNSSRLKSYKKWI
ncbi:MAG: FkbM family methyltransferase [Ignavibacteria bacterium]|nr:FkbM family methyltransferase [Ignavibacteria bacterium]